MRGLIGLLCALALGSGCSSCDDGPAVPFKRAGNPGGQTAPDGGTTAVAPGTGAGSSFPAGTTGLQLGVRLLTLAGGEVRAALQLDRGPGAEPELLLVTRAAEPGATSLQL